MRFLIKDEIKGRIRFNLGRSSLTYREADIFRNRMMKAEGVIKVTVYERTGDAAIVFTCSREEIIACIRGFSFETADVSDTVLYDSARFDDAASSDDGILDCALDQAAVGYDGRCHLAAFEILCRAGVVRTGVDRPVRAEQIGSVL